MSVSVTMPRLGESVTEGTVTRWLKKEGDHVEVDEPLLEVSTDKVDTEIPSPVAGVLSKIKVAEDETVEVGVELAVIDDGPPGVRRQQHRPRLRQQRLQRPHRQRRRRHQPKSQRLNRTPSRPRRSPKRAKSRLRRASTSSTRSRCTRRRRRSCRPRPRPRPAARAAGCRSGQRWRRRWRRLLRHAVGPKAGHRARRRPEQPDWHRRRRPDPQAGRARRAQKRRELPRLPQRAPSAPRCTPRHRPLRQAPAAAALRGRTEKMSRLRGVIASRMVESLQTAAQLTTVVEVDVTASRGCATGRRPTSRHAKA